MTHCDKSLCVRTGGHALEGERTGIEVSGEERSRERWPGESPSAFWWRTEHRDICDPSRATYLVLTTRMKEREGVLPSAGHITKGDRASQR
jgi:hypothetical protein